MRLLNLPRAVSSPAVLSPVLLFLGAVAVGFALGLSGVLAEAASFAVDPLIMLLLALIFLEVRIGGGGGLLRSRRAAAVVLVMNFLLLPVLALGLVLLLVPGDPAVRLGLLIYLLFPCTDWFLGFTRIAGGNTALGAALIPVSLVLQLLLFPFWISLVTGRELPSVMEALWPALIEGLLLPVATAVLLRVVLRLLAGPAALGRVQRVAGALVPWVIAGLILALFTAGASDALLRPTVVLQVLSAASLFFAASLLLARAARRWLRLAEADFSLAAVSGASRNAPLMLAVSALALGEQPVVAAVIVLGMLLEFPHLAVLSGWLRRRVRAGRGRGRPGSSEALTTAA